MEIFWVKSVYVLYYDCWYDKMCLLLIKTPSSWSPTQAKWTYCLSIVVINSATAIPLCEFVFRFIKTYEKFRIFGNYQMYQIKLFWCRPSNHRCSDRSNRIKFTETVSHQLAKWHTCYPTRILENLFSSFISRLQYSYCTLDIAFIFH